MFDIRFNKGRGKNYRHWRVKDLTNKSVEYYDPETFILVMQKCLLLNNLNKAEKVFKTQVRDVCGYIRCCSYKLHKKYSFDTSSLEELLYDPKIAPFWRKGESSCDNYKFESLITQGRRIFNCKLSKLPGGYGLEPCRECQM
jgi:hypothetical protein